jgi:hypothetical protein
VNGASKVTWVEPYQDRAERRHASSYCRNTEGLNSWDSAFVLVDKSAMRVLAADVVQSRCTAGVDGSPG